MAEWQAPAKVNLTLRVGSSGADGYHRIRSLVHTVDWFDTLSIEIGDDDVLTVEGVSIPGGEPNLVWKAIRELAGNATRPPLDLHLTKRIPVAAGLGGGSADAAAALLGVADALGWEVGPGVAARVGADVPFLVVGGSAWMEGRGDLITPAAALTGFALAIVVPPFELSTAEVYRRWDELGEPEDSGISGPALPPTLRREEPLMNDLIAAALSMRPELADWMADLARTWGRPVSMSGSGPALFGFFTDVEEANAAAREAPGDARAAQGVSLREAGPARIDR